MAMRDQSASGSSSAPLSKSFWKRLLFGTLLGSGGLGYYLFLNSKDRPSKWLLASYIAGSAGWTLVNSAVLDMSRSSPECSDNLLNQEIPENKTMTEEFSDDECVSETLKHSFNSKRLFIKFTEVNFDMNTESVRKMFNTKCSECEKVVRNQTSSELFKTDNLCESADSEMLNSNVKIHFPNKLKEVMSSRFYFWYRGKMTRGAALLQNKILLVISEFDKLVQHSINPKTPGGHPNVLYMKKKTQDEYILPSDLNWESCVIIDLIRGIINHLQSKLKCEAVYFESTIINKWENEMENLRCMTLNEAFGILTSPEASYVQESGTQTEFVYHCEEPRTRASFSKCVQQ